jgi:VWFA-related protein
VLAWISAIAIVTAIRAQQPTFRAGVTLVPVDVRVVDRSGKPVIDLEAEDFTIVEDGVPQQIRHFSKQAFTQSLDPDRKTAAGSVDDTPAPLNSAAVPAIAPQTSRVFLIVLGRGRLQVPNRGVDAAIHLVRNRLLPQDRVALLAYNRATDFTADHASVERVLERFKKGFEDIEVKLALYYSGLAALYAKPGIPDYLQKNVDAIFDAERSPTSRTVPHVGIDEDRRDVEHRRRVAGTLLGDPAASATDKAEAALEGMGFEAYVATVTHDAVDAANINAGIDYLRHVEGEKHLVYIAFGGLSINPDGLARAASHARVALDIVHTGGIALPPASMTPRIGPRVGPDDSPWYHYLYGGTSAVTAQNAKEMSSETGGTFYANRHRLASDDVDAMDRASRFQYLLGYYSTRTTTDGSYRRIDVRVKRPNVTLLFRRGYYARPPAPAIGRREVLSYTRITRALAYAGEVSDIKVRGRARRVRDPERGVRVDVTIDPSRVSLKPENGRYVGAIEMAIFALDGRQQSVADLWERVELNLSEATYRQFMAGGIPYSGTIATPANVSSVKIVAYDYPADLVGSIVLEPTAR